jgi:hypothetical protein
MLPTITEMTGMHHHTQLFFGEMGVSQTFYLGWHQTLILPILASQVTRFANVSHQHPELYKPVLFLDLIHHSSLARFFYSVTNLSLI